MWFQTSRGLCCSYDHSPRHQDVKLLAINQKDRRRSQMASTHGSTVVGAPRRCIRYENEIVVPRQNVTALCFKYFNIIDVHNHYMQIWHKLLVGNWAIRNSARWPVKDFMFLFDVAIVNAYKHFMSHSDAKGSYKNQHHKWKLQLAYKLVNNNLEEPPSRDRKSVV